ncbi:hypothetical protein ILUMI_04203 [Ignelater luminosus]|uniref:RNase H type-1 domain-containing protein n=1 Tax=Ignelater luminosus TaxID=2038154 RepID=A0A8K0DEB0_IGNLU|nr:hypothetical protein ILUMI_04203 [Ignelater luminosus]
MTIVTEERNNGEGYRQDETTTKITNQDEIPEKMATVCRMDVKRFPKAGPRTIFKTNDVARLVQFNFLRVRVRVRWVKAHLGTERHSDELAREAATEKEYLTNILHYHGLSDFLAAMVARLVERWAQRSDRRVNSGSGLQEGFKLWVLDRSERSCGSGQTSASTSNSRNQLLEGMWEPS